MTNTTITQPENLSAEAFLRIDVNQPERLFPASEVGVKQLYHKLAKQWFPDLNPDPKATKVFTHLAALHNKAKEKLAEGVWNKLGTVSFKLKDGKTLRVPSDVVRDVDSGLGTMHISPTTVTYVLHKDNADLFKNAVARIGSLSFVDKKMGEIYAPCLPTTTKTYETANEFILTIKKRADDVVLRDLLPLIPADKRATHVAWITSRLHEMVRYLAHVGIAHNAFTLDNVFVSATGHSIGLFGGWWYASAFGKPLMAVPGEAVEFLPDTSKKPALADGKIDREMIRAAAREMLGDRGGTKLKAMKAAPQPMIDYLRLPSSGDAQQDLHDWYQNILPKSFGARRFTELPISYSDVYQPGG